MGRSRVYCFLTVLVLMTLLCGMSWGADITGTITDASQTTGRIYVILKGNWGNDEYGTSVVANGSGSYSYTIYGVRPGTYQQVVAFLDTRAGTAPGSPYGGSLIGGTDPASPLVVPDSGNLSNINFPLAPQPPPATLPAPAGVNASPMNGGAFVFWDTPTDPNTDIEIAEHYNLYWGSTAQVSPTNNLGSVQDIPSAINSGHQGLILPTGTYYFAVEAVLGAQKSAVAVSQPFVVGPPAGGTTVSGSVRFASFQQSDLSASTPLIVVLSDQNDTNFMARITAFAADAAANGQPFSVAGVLPGNYEVFAFLDENNNGRLDLGDIRTNFDATQVTVQGAPVTSPDIQIVKQNVDAQLTTIYRNDYPQPTYYLSARFNPQAKQPAHIELTSGPGVDRTSIGMSDGDELRGDIPLPAAPKVGDSYGGTVYYTDGSSEPLPVTFRISGVVDTLPSLNYPGNDTGPDGIAPTFAWSTPTQPAGDYHFQVEMNSNNSWWETSLSAENLSVKYDGSPLATGSYYNWGVKIVDRFGNRSEGWYNFRPLSTGPAIAGLDKLSGVRDELVTISGSGLYTDPNSTQVYFNGTIAEITNSSATSLTVKVPDGASPGPVRVTVNGVSAGSAQVFTPLISYYGLVVDEGSLPLAGVTVTQVEDPAVTFTTGADGKFTLSGIRGGVPCTLKYETAGYLTSYLASRIYFKNVANSTSPRSQTLYPSAKLTEWGISAGKGVIRSRVMLSGGSVNLAGATVSAYSTLHPFTPYEVTYTDPAGTATGSDGVYYVKNVDDGDVVVVSGEMAGYSIADRTFFTHAGTLSQTPLIAEALPAISGFTPLSAVPGSSITITGNNFSTSLQLNVVTFPSNMQGSVQGTVTSATATLLVVTVPCGAIAGPVSVTVNGLTATSAASLTFPAPTITSFTPTSILANSFATVTITGTNFSTCQYETSVSFYDNQWAGISNATPTELVVNVPFGAATGPIVVTTPYGSATSSTNFTITPPPVMNSLSPVSGPAGTSVSISGTFYDPDKTKYQVTLAGVPATVTNVTATALVFTVPAGMFGGPVPVQVDYYGNFYFPGSFTFLYQLTTTITGSGSINGIEPGQSFSCASGICSQNYGYGAQLYLHASPSAGYQFQGWSGACSGTADCWLNLYGDQSVTAIFDQLMYIRNGSNYYPMLQNGFDAAINNDVIEAQAQTFTELSLLFNRPAAQVKFKGGYDGSFATNSGFTTLDGKLSIRSGTLRVDKLKIK
jgi:IPT/TIG domain-containing protein/List-Bact-rpt repeat protein